MADTKRFNEDLFYGKLGEIRFYSYVKFNEGFTGIDDVSNIKQFQDLDVDFVLHQTDGKDLWVEVKNDKETDKTGHVFTN